MTNGIISSLGMTACLRHPNSGETEAQTWVPVEAGQLEGYTLSVWVNVQNYENLLSYLCGAAVTTTPATTQPTVGAIGVGAGSRTGRLYTQPGDANNASRAPCSLMNQGPVHLAMRCRRISPTQFQFIPYINGVPQWEFTGNITNLNLSGFYGGAYSNDPARLNIAGNRMQSSDPWDYVRFTPWCMTEDQLSAEYLRQRAKLGYAQPKRLLIFCADSLMAFQDAPSWAIARSPVLRPGLFTAMDAWGGTFYAATGNNYAAPTRRSLRQRMIKYGSRHYEKVIVYWPYGTNDIGGAGRLMSGANWLQGANTIDAMIAEDRNTADDPSNVENWGQTILPRADFLTTRPAWETNRLDYNTWRKANPGIFTKIIDAASWTPAGFTTFEECVLHAANNNGNAHILADGLHWEDGTMIATELHIPELEQELAA